MKGIILIIDGNYQLMKTVFPLHQANTLYGELFNVLQNTFEKQINLFPFHQVFFVSDSKNSWRKQINQTYKANRSKKEEVDWNFVFQCYTEFKQKVGSNKCVHLEYTGLEGDDWIAGIVKKANENGYSTLTISSDQDLLQLLSWSTEPDYINIQYRDNLMQEKVWFPKGYNVFLNKLRRTEIDLFALDWRQDFYELLKKLNRYQTIEVNPQQELFCKVISGDAGDNISSTLITYTKTGKPRGIGEAGALKIWNKYLEAADEFVDYNNHEILELMTNLILEYKKVESEATIYRKVFDKVNENIKMIKLQQEYMPVEYQRVLNESIDSVLKL
jgi:5'-3' exonuclease